MLLSSIDVAVPCYQYGRFLRDCVHSILGQEIEALRVLIIDNASNDDSLEVARELAAEDSRVEVIAHRVNLGHHASFNEGIDWAEADYFLILGANDLLTPGALRRAMSFLDHNTDIHLVCGRVSIMGKEPDVQPDPVPIEPVDAHWQMLSGLAALERVCATGGDGRPPCNLTCIDGATAVVRTAVQKQVGHYRAHLGYTDDCEMWMRFACHGGIAETTAVQAWIRDLPGRRAAVRIWRVEREAAFRSFFEREGADLADGKRLDRLWRTRLGERAYWSGVKCLLGGRFEMATQLLEIARRNSPTHAVIPPVGYLLRRSWPWAFDAPAREQTPGPGARMQ